MGGRHPHVGAVADRDQLTFEHQRDSAKGSVGLAAKRKRHVRTDLHPVKLGFGLDDARRLRSRPGRKSVDPLQRVASVHRVVQNLFRVGRHLLRSVHHRLLRVRAFSEWDAVTCAW